MLFKKQAPKIILFFILSIFIASCAGPKVSRVGTDTVTDLSGRWNDTDSRLVAEEMVKDALSRTWIDNYLKKYGRQPVVIVGTVLNRSHEHINVQTFTKDLERELTNSGRVQFVASRGEREEIREERVDQAQHSSDATAKGPGKEHGADYMLKGTINTILDEAKGTKVIFYQVDLELIDIEKNTKVWFGQKKIKKVIERSRSGF
ncbi:MAG: penicillin-binding protein activator LpoB [Nitrospirae bacterium]|nr:penicillin-binding protein activator LpoB [Nitrospirota bacterium]